MLRKPQFCAGLVIHENTALRTILFPFYIFCVKKIIDMYCTVHTIVLYY